MIIVQSGRLFTQTSGSDADEHTGRQEQHQIIVEEVGRVKDLRFNGEAGPGGTGFVVEKALEEALGFSPQGMATPQEGGPEWWGRRSGCFIRRG